MVVCEERDENNSNVEEEVPKSEKMANKSNKVKLGKGEQTITFEFEDDLGRSFEATINISNIVIKCKEVIEQSLEKNLDQKLSEKNSLEREKKTSVPSDSSPKKHNNASIRKNVKVPASKSPKHNNLNETLLKKVSDADKLVNEFFKTENKFKNPFEAFYLHYQPTLMNFTAVKKSNEEPAIKVEPRENDFVDLTRTAKDPKPTNETPIEKKLTECRTTVENCQQNLDSITKLLKENDTTLEELSKEFLEANDAVASDLVKKDELKEELSKNIENDSVDEVPITSASKFTKKALGDKEVIAYRTAVQYRQQNPVSTTKLSKENDRGLEELSKEFLEDGDAAARKLVKENDKMKNLSSEENPTDLVKENDKTKNLSFEEKLAELLKENDKMKNRGSEEKSAEESSSQSSLPTASSVCQKLVHDKPVLPSTQISSDVSKKDSETVSASASQKSSKLEPVIGSCEKNKILKPSNSISKSEKEKICSSSVQSSEEPSNSRDVKSLKKTEDKDLTEPDSGYISANQTTATTADQETLDISSKKIKEKPTAVVSGFRRENNARNEPPVETPQPRPATTQPNREITSTHVSTTSPNRQSSTTVRTSTPINEISNREFSSAVRTSTPVYQNQPSLRNIFDSSSDRFDEILSPIRREQTLLTSFNLSLGNDTYGSYQESRIPSPRTSLGSRERTMKFDNFVSNSKHYGPVTDLPGVGKVGGGRLRAAGIHTVGDMHQVFQKLGGDESSFKRWFQNVSGLNSRWASHCYDALEYM